MRLPGSGDFRGRVTPTVRGATRSRPVSHLRTRLRRSLPLLADMARFAVGVMGGRYFPDDVLYQEVLRPETGTYGYGWGVDNVGGDDLTAAHGGSNGLPRAYVLLKPRRNAAVVILAQMKIVAPLDLDALAGSVLRVSGENDARRP